jgi:large subunit ribosomal protein L13
MNTLSYRTITPKAEQINKEWLLVDAENEIVGRLATKVASLLRGKYKTNYTPHLDCGDNVIIINAEKIRFTGKKMDDKQYIHYSGYPGGQKKATPAEVLRKKPNYILEEAIRGMLPKNRLGAELFRNLRVFVGTEHDHVAQKPRLINIHEIK